MIEIIYFALMGIPPLAIAGFILVGFFSPRHYRLKESKVIKASQEKVWQSIRNFEEYPTWLSYASEVTPKKNEDGTQTWLQTGDLISVEFEILEERAPTFLKMNQKRNGGSVTGQREIKLAMKSANETQVDVVQEGQILDPIMKAYLIFFHYFKNPVKLFLNDLEKKYEIQ